ncbi:MULTISPECIES: hypothetical protein [Actinoplanes]|uniref:hypothetical protein n=1 Tax=Actinoplanes TaxID=1865 RepID=UPI0005F2E3F8|nr:MULTISPECIES: hypothetical protein [Actinoplanes]GLY01729.1 hypothetical protein Acsp01_21080 [Actinoplanes sp. NBRC 101535]
MEANPYAEQTAANTSAGWLGDGPTVDVDLDGLREYALRIAEQRNFLESRADDLQVLAGYPAEAFAGDLLLGEVATIRTTLEANAREMAVYLDALRLALGDISVVASRIADIFQDTDATSAASINDVSSAFATPLPGTTTETGKPEFGDGVYRPDPNAPGSNNQIVQVATGPNGEHLQLKTLSVPGSPVVTTETVHGTNGVLLSTSTTLTSTRTDGPVETITQEKYDGDGALVSKIETRTTHVGDEVVARQVESVDGKGRTTELTTENLDPGTKENTVVTLRPGESGLLEETNRIVVGPRTAGPSPLGG